jgi:hypothetical protein
VDIHLHSRGHATQRGLKTPSIADIAVKPTSAQVQTLLRQLFPALSDADIADFASKLDLEAALALKVEIDDIRRIADKLSKALADLADKAAASRATTSSA